MISLFGTDGIRGKAGHGYLTTDALFLIGAALAQWALTRSTHPRILIAHDTRISCAWMKSALKTGLLSFPVELIDAGVLPTPTAFHLIKSLKYDVALVISASHNPYTDNGIKIIDARHGKLLAEDEHFISHLFHNPSPLSYTFGNEHILTDALSHAVNIFKNIFPLPFLKNKKIVLDTANGATSILAPLIYTALGANVITINNEPNGTNINDDCGTLHLTPLQQAVHRHRAAIGFAFDGDGDRVIAVNSAGSIKNGDDILSLLLSHPAYHQQQTIVGTIMSNYGFEQFLTAQNKTLIRTPVGDKYIKEALDKHQLLLGGEQSGHIILHDLLGSGDGILTSLRVLEALIVTDNWELTTFEHTPQVLINHAITHKKDLTSGICAQLIQHAQETLSHTGRILVRYSGTEQLIRVMVEAPHYEQAYKTAQHLTQQLLQELTPS